MQPVRTFMLSLALTLAQCSEPAELAPPNPVPMASPHLTVHNWPQDGEAIAHVHVVTIPPGYPVNVAVDSDLKTVQEFAMETNALAVLNGGFFDPNNGQTTSFITVDGALAADPRHNQQLMNNPDLAIYIDAILNRSEFRRYDCGDSIRYDITPHSAPMPQGCLLHMALGAGPQLLPDTSQAEGFTDYRNGALIRDALGGQSRNARSAVGLKPDGTLVWVMVARATPAGGMTLAELADYMVTMEVQKGLNLDGGSSSSLYFDQRLVGFENNQSGVEPTDQSHNLRPVKSVLVLPHQP